MNKQKTVIVKKKSPITGRMNQLELSISEEQWNKWQEGALIQNVMPHLSAEEREFLITGMTPAEQKKMYDNLDDEEE